MSDVHVWVHGWFRRIAEGYGHEGLVRAIDAALEADRAAKAVADAA